MNSHSHLSRHVNAREILKPWVILGPLYENISTQVTGLTLFEEPKGNGGCDYINQIYQEGNSFLITHRACEGRQDAFRGQTARWELVRGPEEFFTWGNYITQNHAVSAVISTMVVPDQPGMHHWQVTTRVASAVSVAINGQVVFESGLRPATIMEGQEDSVYQFDAELQAGENTVSVYLLRAGRMARIGCRVEVLNGDVTVSAPLGKEVSLANRVKVEEMLSGMRLEREVIYPEQDAALILSTAPNPETPLRVSLTNAAGETLREVTPQSAGRLVLCPGSELIDGTYSITCLWLNNQGSPLTSAAYHLQKITPTPVMVGYDRLEERKRFVLEQYAGGHDARPIWTQIARYALGRYNEVDEEAIREACRFIAARFDTSDFVMQGILRLLYWEQKQPRLSPGIRQLMKETVLGFKYWVDEPGDTVMWMDSENHRFLFHTAEWLAGQLYPLEEFSNSRQLGLFHALKGRTYAVDWMRQRGNFGFDEWHSSAYYPADIAPLLNIYDFAPYEDHKLRLLAGSLLDYIFFNLAADSYQGNFGTTHGRSYLRELIHPDFQGTAGVSWLAFGRGAIRQDAGAMSPVAMATSVYRLPQILAEIAEDHTAVVDAKERQGVASKGYQEFYPNQDKFADFCVYRTPDYLMSGLQDYRKGEYEPTVHPAQINMGNQAAIFWSSPYTCNEGGGLRPDYWSGSTTLPRVIQHRNVMALTFRLSYHAWMSHCYFDTTRFDEVRFEGNWAFARAGKGYLGIWSQNGYKVGDYGQYAGRELLSTAAENTWLAECGRETDWGSFDAFVDGLLAANVTAQNGVITYDSPSIGRFVTGWDAAPTVNGEAIQLHGYPLVDSAWAHSDFGSGVLRIRYGEKTHELYFNH